MLVYALLCTSRPGDVALLPARIQPGRLYVIMIESQQPLQDLPRTELLRIINATDGPWNGLPLTEKDRPTLERIALRAMRAQSTRGQYRAADTMPQASAAS